MANLQRTISKESSIAGIGLHSGQICKLKVKPAVEGGIVFYRVDLVPNFAIEASFIYQIPSSYHTVLTKQNVSVETVEHFLSALHALQIDNLQIELNSPELPILDGCAATWIKFLEDCKIQELATKKKFFKVKKEVRVGGEHNYASFIPANKPIFRFFIDFNHPLIQQQSYSFQLNLENYKKEIASCRTFGFETDLECMKKQGLIKGGSLANAIVLLKDGTMLNKQKLCFDNEFVRHKILDAIGDIYLGGRSIIGEYYGHKSSHRLNTQLLAKLLTSL